MHLLMRQGNWLLAFPSKLWPISKNCVVECKREWTCACIGEISYVTKEKQCWSRKKGKSRTEFFTLKDVWRGINYRTKKRVSEERRDVWAVGNRLRNMKPLCCLVISRSDDLSKIRTATGDLPLSSLFPYLQLTVSSNPQDFHSPHPSRLSGTVHWANVLSRVLGLPSMRKCHQASNDPTSTWA